MTLSYAGERSMAEITEDWGLEYEGKSHEAEKGFLICYIVGRGHAMETRGRSQ